MGWHEWQFLFQIGRERDYNRNAIMTTKIWRRERGGEVLADRLCVALHKSNVIKIKARLSCRLWKEQKLWHFKCGSQTRTVCRKCKGGVNPDRSGESRWPDRFFAFSLTRLLIAPFLLPGIKVGSGMRPSELEGGHVTWHDNVIHESCQLHHDSWLSSDCYCFDNNNQW